MVACNDSAELLRVTVLSLEGIQIFSACGDNNDGDAAVDTNKNANGGGGHNVVAWAGFRSSFPPGAMAVPSSQYSTLFTAAAAAEGGGDDNNLLAVASEEVAWRGENNFGMSMRWCDGGDCEGKGSRGVAEERGETSSGREDSTQNVAPQCQKLVPHLEIALSSTTLNDGTHTAELPPYVIEFHVCVMCAPSSADEIHSYVGDDVLDESYDDDASAGMEEHSGKEKRNVCCGIALLKFSPSELSLYVGGMNTGENADLICRRSGGKVIRLPVKTSEPYPNDNESNDILIAFAKNALLSVQVEKISVPVQYLEEKEQRHYIESDWNRGESFAPVSIMHDESVVCRNTEGNGLGQLWRRATSTLAITTTPTSPTKATPVIQPPKIEKRDDMVGKIVEAIDSRCPSNLTSSERIMNEISSSEFVKRPSQRKTLGRKSSSKRTSTSSPEPPKKSSSQTLSKRFFCGASFSGVGDALRMAAAAGHHCDEDHVGLYVVDTESLSSSIDTADVMGF